MPQKIDLIFTRDFSLTMNDFWHFLLSQRIVEEFGAGISSQLVYFNGRAAECYRVSAESEAVKEKVLEKSSEDLLFSEERTRIFRNDIDEIHSLLEKFPTNLENVFKSFEKIRPIFTRMYPWYMLSVFLPNPWQEAAKIRFQNEAEEILDRMFKNRVYAEGMFEHIDFYIRKILEEIGKLPRPFLHLVRLDEFDAWLRGEKFPSEEELSLRAKGYILFEGNLFLEKSFREFLSEHDFFYDDPSPEKPVSEIHGQVACEGGILKGKVRIIMNAEEVKFFVKGEILVTTMTSPEYMLQMKESLAIITDEGGITCHAAIVSRELGIPCVIGTKIATKVFKDGDMVEVDATKGIVRILKKK